MCTLAFISLLGLTTRRQVEQREATYRATLPKHRWLKMARDLLRTCCISLAPSYAEDASGLSARQVRSRFWSTFSGFTDAELEQGIAELEQANPVKIYRRRPACGPCSALLAGRACVAHPRSLQGESVQFNDRLLLLVGRKLDT